MDPRSQTWRRFRPLVELLEARIALSVPPTLVIPLDPALDQFGDQVATVQAYGDPSRAAFSIFDTGASAITFSPDDLALFTDGTSDIPVKVPGGADAEGIGGAIVGDVSEPGTILADGFHAVNFSFDDLGLPDLGIAFGPDSATTPGIQAFLGTADGSPDLPTITGTPILNASPEHPRGLAALVDMQGAALDFSDLIPGLVLTMPDLHFVAPGAAPTVATGTTDPVYVATSLFGGDNHTDPGDLITESPSPVQRAVSLAQGTAGVHGRTFLFDTGAQLSIISTPVARALGLDLAHPETSITVQGVGGSQDVPGYTIDALELPRTDGGVLRFTDVPVYVLDVAPGLDGILGMNLWNTAASFVYDPFNPAGSSVGFTFFTDPDRGGGDIDPGQLDLLQGLGVNFAGMLNGHALPGFDVHAGSISGQVFQDGNANGVKNVGEAGLAGWTVFLDANNNGQLDAGERTTTTISTGGFAFTGLKPGLYVVAELLPAGWIRSAPAGGRFAVAVASGQTAGGKFFGNYLPAIVTGLVFNDANGNGVKDAGEAVLVGITMFVDENNNGVLDAGERTCVTHSNGAYTLAMKPGTHTVREVVPAGLVLTTPGSLTLTLTSGQKVTGKNFGNHPSASTAPLSPLAVDSVFSFPTV